MDLLPVELKYKIVTYLTNTGDLCRLGSTDITFQALVDNIFFERVQDIHLEAALFTEFHTYLTMTWISVRGIKYTTRVPIPHTALNRREFERKMGWIWKHCINVRRLAITGYEARSQQPGFVVGTGCSFVHAAKVMRICMETDKRHITHFAYQPRATEVPGVITDNMVAMIKACTPNLLTLKIENGGTQRKDALTAASENPGLKKLVCQLRRRAPVDYADLFCESDSDDEEESDPTYHDIEIQSAHSDFRWIFLVLEKCSIEVLVLLEGTQCFSIGMHITLEMFELNKALGVDIGSTQPHYFTKNTRYYLPLIQCQLGTLGFSDAVASMIYDVRQKMGGGIFALAMHYYYLCDTQMTINESYVLVSSAQNQGIYMQHQPWGCFDSVE